MTKPKKKTTSKPRLTPKQRLFCEYYLQHPNATKAYQKAYGVNYRSANISSVAVMALPQVKEYIEKHKQLLYDSLQFDTREIIAQYVKIARSEISDVLNFGREEVPILDPTTGAIMKDEKGKPLTYSRNFIHLKDSEEVDGGVVSSVKLQNGGLAVKMHDKMRALEMLSRIFDLAPDARKRQLEEALLAHQVNELSKDGDNAHAKGMSYLEALNAKAENVFDDEDEDEEYEDERDSDLPQ